MGKAVGVRDIKLVSIGNSKGIRLPKALLQKYGWSDSLVLEETDEGIYLYSKEKNKLSWQETYRDMATEDEDWDSLRRRSPMGWIDGGLSEEIRNLLCRPQPQHRWGDTQSAAGCNSQPERDEQIPDHRGCLPTYLSSPSHVA